MSRCAGYSAGMEQPVDPPQGQESRPINKLLKMAVWAGAETAVRLHIARGDDLDSRDEQGLTPLMLAAARNKAAICRLLIDAGADVHAVDGKRRDALGLAIGSNALSAAAEIERAMRQRAELVNPAQLDSLVIPVGPDIDSLPAPGLLDEANSQKALDEESQFAYEQEPPHVVDGKQHNALELAIASNGLSATAEIEAALHQRTELVNDVQPSSLAISPEPETESLPAPRLLDEANSPTAFHGESAFADKQDGAFDLEGWLAETEDAAPEDDRGAALAQATAHTQLASRLPLDDSPEWESVLASLPSQAARIPRAQAHEAQTGLRLLLLRALREGSVPEHAIEQAVEELAGAQETDTEALLRLVVNDLGAEADERFEFRSPWETSEAFVDPQESLSEEIEVDDALDFFSDLRSSHSDALRLYMKQAQRGHLLTHKEEIELATIIESASARAICVLARWPEAIRAICSALERARNDELPLGSIARINHDAPEDAGEAGLIEPSAESESSPVNEWVPESEPIASIPEDCPAASGIYDMERQTSAENAYLLADQLRAFLNINPQLYYSTLEIEQALSGLALKSSYLLRLAEEVKAPGSAHRLDYLQAVRPLRVARDRMICSNLRLVIVHARKYLFSGIPLLDLIQEGNIGLISAVDKFDWRRGLRFSTMATWWIRQAISRSVADTRLLIRLPVHVYEKVPRPLGDSEAVDAFVGSRKGMDELAASSGRPRHKLEAMLRPLSSPLPIEALDDDDLRDADGADPTASVYRQQLREAVRSLLFELSPKTANVIRLRFGIDTYEALTLEEIGERFGLTRERIRQIEAKAMRLSLLRNRLAPWAPPKEERETPTDIQITRAAPERPPLESGPIVNPEGERRSPAPNVASWPGMPPERAKMAESALRQARELDIPVKWVIKANGERPLVCISRGRNDAERRLIRLLCRVGFQFRPEQGYCL